MARFAPNTHALAADQAIARLRNGLEARVLALCPSDAAEASEDLRLALGLRDRRAYALATRSAQRGLRRIGGES